MVLSDGYRAGLTATKSHLIEVPEDSSAVHELLGDETSGGEHRDTTVLELLGAQIAELAGHGVKGTTSGGREFKGVEVQVTGDVVCVDSMIRRIELVFEYDISRSLTNCKVVRGRENILASCIVCRWIPTLFEPGQGTDRLVGARPAFSDGECLKDPSPKQRDQPKARGEFLNLTEVRDRGTFNLTAVERMPLLRDDDCKGCDHGQAPVLQLGLAPALQSLLIHTRREAQRIEEPRRRKLARQIGIDDSHLHLGSCESGDALIWTECISSSEECSEDHSHTCKYCKVLLFMNGQNSTRI
jgi:hypothetical protein